ncbi:MAG: hypothetical protein M1423_02805, partial [Acidobacteria bacterium]|nr:hypothetical protein [Acidobacteriota bacterium]
MKTSRRNFLGYGITAAAAAGSLRGARSNARSTFLDILRPPDHLTAYAENAPELPLKRSGERWRARDVEVVTEVNERGQDRELSIKINSPQTFLTRLHLRWSGQFRENLRLLGDQWERAYGDLEWRGFAGDRIMPWYFIASDGRVTHACGVKTGANAFCFWQADPAGISLWLDVRNGGSGVRLGERQLAAAAVVAEEDQAGANPLQAARKFCRRLCRSPRLPDKPVYGSNNWYYLYGDNMTAENVLSDVEQLAELSPASSNRPYMVIDMGWGKAPQGAGPWTQANCRLA